MTTTTICTEHANEVLLIEDALDPRGGAIVSLGLVNQDGSDTFPGRTLTPDQAEQLAATLASSAAAARASAGLAPTPVAGEQAHSETLNAIRAAVPLTNPSPALADSHDEQAQAAASPPADAKATPSRPPLPTAGTVSTSISGSPAATDWPSGFSHRTS
jgi:hypothetical protein